MHTGSQGEDPRSSALFTRDSINLINAIQFSNFLDLEGAPKAANKARQAVPARPRVKRVMHNSAP